MTGKGNAASGRSQRQARYATLPDPDCHFPFPFLVEIRQEPWFRSGVGRLEHCQQSLGRRPLHSPCQLENSLGFRIAFDETSRGE